jgi:hypothetical protein
MIWIGLASAQLLSCAGGRSSNGAASGGPVPAIGAAPQDGADAGASVTQQEKDLRARLADAIGRSDLDALDSLAGSAETLGPASAEPASLWLLAAQARRLRTDSYASRASAAPIEATPGSSVHELLALLSVEAKDCAADAHRVWAAQLPEAAAAIDAGKPATGALANASVSSAEPLYLEALCSAAWARAQGFTFFVEQRGLLEGALTEAAKLSPRLDGAGPDRELGRLFASLPGYAGGDLLKARTHFELAIATAPEALWNRVLFARSVAVKQQDRKLFTQLLNEVLAQPATDASAQSAKDEARSLLDHGDDLFGATPR